MIEINPKFPDAYYGIAHTYAKKGENNLAIEYFNKAKELDPGRSKKIDKLIDQLIQ